MTFNLIFMPLSWLLGSLLALVVPLIFYYIIRYLKYGRFNKIYKEGEYMIANFIGWIELALSSGLFVFYIEKYFRGEYFLIEPLFPGTFFIFSILGMIASGVTIIFTQKVTITALKKEDDLE